ncbi:MAG: hypothetical protein ACTSUS_08110 [Candidatus Freyarchaeota archaeon]
MFALIPQLKHAGFPAHDVKGDFIDCLILSSAVNRSDALITEDEDIRNLGKRELQEIFQAVNPEFRIQTLKDVL